LSHSESILKQQFEALFRAYFTGLCYFARKYTGDTDSAKEIVHQVFIRIWENRNTFAWDKPAKSYLYTAVYNRSLNFLRDQRKFVSHDEALKHHAMNEQVVPENTLEASELENRIMAALKRLPEKCREAFELSRFEGKTYPEIAENLNISVKTVESHMSKALRFLRDELKDYLMLVWILFIKIFYP
jgi:RNA polymerase sigma-70 factor (ECF subfamily)